VYSVLWEMVVVGGCILGLILSLGEDESRFRVGRGRRRVSIGLALRMKEGGRERERR
jgi:hypothetical protein